MEIRKALFFGRENSRMKFFVEWPGARERDGALLRLPVDEVDGEAELATVTVKVYRDRRISEFVDFLRNTVVTDPDGKVSPRSIWNGWAGRPADTEIDRDEEVAGIRFDDVQELFSAVFDAGERVRGRLDGNVQRVWLGYRLDPPDESGNE